jgi:hypothetical protein
MNGTTNSGITKAKIVRIGTYNGFLLNDSISISVKVNPKAIQTHKRKALTPQPLK